VAVLAAFEFVAVGVSAVGVPAVSVGRNSVRFGRVRRGGSSERRDGPSVPVPRSSFVRESETRARRRVRRHMDGRDRILLLASVCVKRAKTADPQYYNLFVALEFL